MRIALSRVFGLLFLVALLFTGSAREGNISSTVLFMIGLVLVGIATVGRLWCALYISGRKKTELVTSGPYSTTRNPLYFFSLLGFAGVGFATETVTLGIAFAALFLLVYPFVIRREEQLLLAHFGEEFTSYCRTTPRFFPRFAALREPDSYTVDPRRFRRAAGEAMWFVFLVGLVELIEGLHEYGFLTARISLP